MGMIKLPQNAINFFKQNLDEIFDSGNLAEGKWNSELSEYVSNYCRVKITSTTPLC